jgi:hypothetical protein
LSVYEMTFCANIRLAEAAESQHMYFAFLM